MSKTSKFVPLTGTVGGIVALVVDTYMNGTINETLFVAFMGFTVGGSSAYAIVKKLRK